MPRNGSGTYSLPSGNPVVTGTTISSTVHNATMTDIGNEISNSLDKDGQTVITGTIDFNAQKLVLDADGDTSITASTDDVIDIEVEGVDAIKVGWQSVADMGRDARLSELAGKGKANIDVDMQKLPNALIREVMVINNILTKASVGVQDKTAKEVSRLLLADPKTGFTELVKLMDKFPPKQKNKFLQMIAEETPMTAEMLKRVGYVTAGTQAGEL